MPYFKTEEIDLYYIHIPKTGGSSIEKYFYRKFGIIPSWQNGFGYSYSNMDNVLRVMMGKVVGCNNTSEEYSYDTIVGKGHTLQHLTYDTIRKYGSALFGVDMSNTTFLATIRNPYERIISDMFFFVVQTNITIHSTKEDIERAIRVYLERTDYDYDNHRLPQYKFLVDSTTNKIAENIVILRMENLTESMHAMGFTDFQEHENKNRTGLSKEYSVVRRKSASPFLEPLSTMNIEDLRESSKDIHVHRCIASPESGEAIEDDFINIRKFLTPEAIRLINEYYRMDFILFSYTML